jgi:hypothetical protein
MRNGQLLAFDDIITSTATAYTTTALYDRLGSHDEISVLAVVDNVSTSGAGFDLFIEHSCDTRSWLQRNDLDQAFPPTEGDGSGDITFSATNPPLLGPNTTYARVFSDPCTGVSKYPPQTGDPGGTGGPMLAYVRFAMKLTAGSAHVKVYVVQRDL